MEEGRRALGTGGEECGAGAPPPAVLRTQGHVFPAPLIEKTAGWPLDAGKGFSGSKAATPPLSSGAFPISVAF